MRCYPQQDGALEAGGAKPAHVGMLNVPDAPMHNFEAVGRGSRGEILTLDERGVEAAQGSFAGRGGTRSAASYHEDVEQFTTQPAEVAADGRCRFHTVMIANSAADCRCGHTGC